MYKTIVAHRVRSTFGELNRGNWGAVNDSLASDFSYEFVGDHALGGRRRSLTAMEQWWRRLFLLFPEAQFEVKDVLVAGPPWATRIATDITIRADLGGDDPYENVFTQMMRMRWGKITSIVTLEDTQLCARTLSTMAARGVAEAAAVPIES